LSGSFRSRCSTSGFSGSAVPREQRDAAGGMSATFMNAGMVLSIGVFFSMLVAGLARSLPKALHSGLTQYGVPGAAVDKISSLPPVGTLFAAFLGVKPIRQLLDAFGVLHSLSATAVSTLTGRTYFPNLISGPFNDGLTVVFTAAMVICVAAAVVAAFRGSRYVYAEVTDAADSLRQPQPGHDESVVFSSLPESPSKLTSTVSNPLVR
jgi:hypothetical protein